MTKEEFCTKYNLTESQFSGEETISGDLGLSSLTTLPDGFNPTIGGGLYLYRLTTLPSGFNPTVGGALDLGSLTSIPDGFNPTVGGSLYLDSLTTLPSGFNPTVGGYLYLGSLTTLPSGFKPTVGGNLYLGSLTTLPDGFNPTVGGGLDLRSLTTLPDGFNPTVGGYLDLPSHLTATTTKPTEPLTWQDGKYISIDGMLTEVVSRRKNLWVVRKLHTTKEFYIVTDGNGKYSHGDTIKEAKEDLIYKLGNLDKSMYNHLTMDTELTFKEAIQAYRVITGACSFGVKDFVESNSIKAKKYKVSEVLKLTDGKYGNTTFKEFIN